MTTPLLTVKKWRPPTVAEIRSGYEWHFSILKAGLAAALVVALLILYFAVTYKAGQIEAPPPSLKNRSANWIRGDLGEATTVVDGAQINEAFAGSVCRLWPKQDGLVVACTAN